MLKNYITVALRNLLRQKGFAIINILGLTIGLTVSALIILYIVHEMGYDRFHENSERIYRVAIDGEISGQKLNVAVSSPPFGPALKNDYPEVEEYTGERRWIRDGITIIPKGTVIESGAEL